MKSLTVVAAAWIAALGITGCKVRQSGSAVRGLAVPDSATNLVGFLYHSSLTGEIFGHICPGRTEDYESVADINKTGGLCQGRTPMGSVPLDTLIAALPAGSFTAEERDRLGLVLQVNELTSTADVPKYRVVWDTFVRLVRKTPASAQPAPDSPESDEPVEVGAEAAAADEPVEVGMEAMSDGSASAIFRKHCNSVDRSRWCDMVTLTEWKIPNWTPTGYLDAVEACDGLGSGWHMATDLTTRINKKFGDGLALDVINRFLEKSGEGSRLKNLVRTQCGATDGCVLDSRGATFVAGTSGYESRASGSFDFDAYLFYFNGSYGGWVRAGVGNDFTSRNRYIPLCGRFLPGVATAALLGQPVRCSAANGKWCGGSFKTPLPQCTYKVEVYRRDGYVNIFATDPTHYCTSFSFGCTADAQYCRSHDHDSGLTFLSNGHYKLHFKAYQRSVGRRVEDTEEWKYAAD